MAVLMEGHNNQPKVGVDGRKGVGEERRPGGACGDDAVSLFGHQNDQRKLIIEKIGRCHVWPPNIK